MLRKNYSSSGSKYVSTIQSTFSNVFLSNSSKHKKFDGSQQSFDFDFADWKDQLINIRSWKDYKESDLHPFGLICAFLLCIGVTYIILGGLSALFFTSSNYHNTIKTDPNLIIEIEEVLGKLIDLRKQGNMKEYEAFLTPSMDKYCLKQLGNSYLNLESLESFHMNIAQIISFIARGNKFTEHRTALGVNRMGGIIDPSNGKPSLSNSDTASKDDSIKDGNINIETRSCPLLDAIYELGAPDKKTYDASIETKEDAQDTKTEKTWQDNDSKTKFDQRYSWKNMKELLHLIQHTIRSSGQCMRIVKELSKENMKAFVLNFYEMADLIGRELQKALDEGLTNEDEVNAFHVNPTAKDFRKYVIGRDGKIYETDVYDTENDEYFRCLGIEMILNNKFVLDENLSYTNVKIAVGEKFDAWYEKLLEKIQ